MKVKSGRKFSSFVDEIKRPKLWSFVVSAQELYKTIALNSSKYDSEKVDNAAYFERCVGYIEEDDRDFKKGSAFKQKKTQSPKT